jgi:hypothetical protein
MVLQHAPRRALSGGFAREEDDARGAEHRDDENTTAWSSYRTMRNGVAAAFLASSFVHATFLRISLRVPMQSGNSGRMVRSWLRRRPGIEPKNIAVVLCGM